MPTTELELDDDDADARALFRLLDDPSSSEAGRSRSWRVEAMAHGRGPWDHRTLHGGAVCGLLAWAAESMGEGEGLRCARLTAEFLSAVPTGPLTVDAEVVKPGRRSRLIDVTVRAGERTVARGGTQWLQPDPGWNGGGRSTVGARPASAIDPADGDLTYPRPGFNCDAVELRPVTGSTEASGPGAVWTRLTSPLMAGQTPSALVRAATLADLAAAAGWERGPDGASYVNPDLTLQLAHPPRGPWVAIDAATRRSAHGLGFIEGTMLDEGGPIGRVLQSLVRSPIDLGGVSEP